MQEGTKETSKVVGLYVLVSAVSWFASEAFPYWPLGLEGFFQFGLGPVGACTGFALARCVSKKIEDFSAVKMLISAVVLLALAVITGISDWYLHASVHTPNFWIILVQGFLYSAFFFLFFMSLRFAGFSISKEPSKSEA